MQRTLFPLFQRFRYYILTLDFFLQSKPQSVSTTDHDDVNALRSVKVFSMSLSHSFSFIILIFRLSSLAFLYFEICFATSSMLIFGVVLKIT